MAVTCQAAELRRHDHEDCCHDFDDDIDLDDEGNEPEDDGTYDFVAGIRPKLTNTIDAILAARGIKGATIDVTQRVMDERAGYIAGVLDTLPDE